MDTIADIGFIGYDIYTLATEGGGQGGEKLDRSWFKHGRSFGPLRDRCWNGLSNCEDNGASERDNASPR